MSFSAMSWASKQKVKTASQKLVLLMLANYADDEDKCWPSKKTLADVCCLSKAAICSNILKLEESGFLSVEKREGTSSIIRLNTGVQKVDRGCPSNGQGVSSRKTGGVQPMDTNLSYTLPTETITETISVDSEFEEFWSIYPRRPNNPRKKAMAAYIRARKNVSQKQLLEAIGLYAAYMAGENPKFIAMASTWLNEERWNCDYSKGAEVIKSYAQAKYGGVFGAELVVSDDDVNGLIRVFPGHVGERDRAKRLLAAEMAKGVQIDQICRAAEKYSLFCKGPPYEDRRITPSMLEPWLQFKWREMEAYEVCYVGADRIKTVRPIKGKS